MKLVKRNVTDVFVLSDPTFRVSMQKQEKTIFLYYFVLIKGIYEIVQANNIYLQKEETMTFHLIIINTLTCFCIENMASYKVDVVRAENNNLVNTHLMTISLYFCDFLELILKLPLTIYYIIAQGKHLKFALSDPNGCNLESRPASILCIIHHIIFLSVNIVSELVIISFLQT